MRQNVGNVRFLIVFWPVFRHFFLFAFRPVGPGLGIGPLVARLVRPVRGVAGIVRIVGSRRPVTEGHTCCIILSLKSIGTERGLNLGSVLICAECILPLNSAGKSQPEPGRCKMPAG